MDNNPSHTMYGNLRTSLIFDLAYLTASRIIATGREMKLCQFSKNYASLDSAPPYVLRL